MSAFNQQRDAGRPSFRVEVATRDAETDIEAKNALRDLQEYGLRELANARSLKIYAFSGALSHRDADRLAGELLTDPVVEMFSVNQPIFPERGKLEHLVEIARRPGVMEPSEASILKGMAELGCQVDRLRLGRRYIFNGPVSKNVLYTAVARVLANPVIEQVSIDGALNLLDDGNNRPFRDRRVIDIVNLGEADLDNLSKTGQFYLSPEEMRAVQAHFAALGRNPADVELETIAQAWSEHCSHKTFRGKVRHREGDAPAESIGNLLKSTIIQTTRELNRPWCWSVFEDNSGVVDFNGDYGIAFKVETHNHPSAIEPYGGAGTGLGGVIRDPLGTGLGGKPILNTDVFCFGPPDLPPDDAPPGAPHPLRVLKGVAAGVRDYGNRMGIPTANGAICFDRRFTGNPLVFCGNLALIPRGMAAKRSPKTGDVALVVGGRTGRDGIHGATFSSVELHDKSEAVSSGAVQIGNPIEEKKVVDFLLSARDAGLYSCITDCGAGGLSSALGEMGAECGVRVELDRVPLKYDGLSHAEIWISEAQERMVIACDPANLPALGELARIENVEIARIADFTGDGRLTLCFHGIQVAQLDMDFIHRGIPMPERESEWRAPDLREPEPIPDENYSRALTALLSSWDICSKEWVIRQYDHEVQGGSVVKPLVGRDNDGPGDAAVVVPILGDPTAIAVANGIKPRFSDIDPYWMAALAIDEALRNLAAVGAPVDRAVLLDNFCWGNCNKPDRLGGLVRAARACRDMALAYGTPFISGKDSLNNEYASGDDTVSIPGTLLISALSVMPDCRLAVTMDAKKAGNHLYLVGPTRNELGGSHYYALRGELGANIPKVKPELGLRIFQAVNQATRTGLVAACHDCSEGGFAVAAAEMAFAGGFGIEADVSLLPVEGEAGPAARLFAESPSRLLLEVEEAKAAGLEGIFDQAGIPYARVGGITAQPRLVLLDDGQKLIDVDVGKLKTAWLSPLPGIL
ncbi:MAG: phosphoribosylformylglycinamidine synthase subunit PurL [Planctomycetota bacterium]|jgi:phosphoribosylformylglycinamidine synthase|nr:phosphoribosylformylglycinamidine synthase subunit PurL [Planctomycetota bacterium]